MSKIKIIAVVAVVGLTIGGFAIAQILHGGRGHRALHSHMNPEAAAKHFGEAFPKVVAFDVNKDGQIDATEKESIAKALAEGKVQFPGHAPFNGGGPRTEEMLNHVPSVYSWIAPYDANHDGALDVTEQGALQEAIKNGGMPFRK